MGFDKYEWHSPLSAALANDLLARMEAKRDEERSATCWNCDTVTKLVVCPRCTAPIPR